MRRADAATPLDSGAGSGAGSPVVIFESDVSLRSDVAIGRRALSGVENAALSLASAATAAWLCAPRWKRRCLVALGGGVGVGVGGGGVGVGQSTNWRPLLRLALAVFVEALAVVLLQRAAYAGLFARPNLFNDVTAIVPTASSRFCSVPFGPSSSSSSSLLPGTSSTGGGGDGGGDDELLVHYLDVSPKRGDAGANGLAVGVHCAHGFGASSLSFLPTAPFLAAKLCARVVAHDQPGFGLTHRPPLRRRRTRRRAEATKDADEEGGEKEEEEEEEGGGLAGRTSEAEAGAEAASGASEPSLRCRRTR